MNYTRLCSIVVCLMLIVCSATVQASGNILSSGKYAWSETGGWLNFNPAGGGVVVYPDHLEGYAWLENIGWVKTGSYSGGGTHTYTNLTATDWGVNLDGSVFSGFAWSDSAGWINFKPIGGGVTFDTATGVLDGYAWAENLGWLHFKGSSPAYNVRLNSVTLTVALAGNGSGSVHSSPGGISCDSTLTGCSSPFYQYWPVTLSATPDWKSLFTGYSGGSTDAAFSMDTNRDVTATFTSKTCTITASAGAHGSITPTAIYNYGSSPIYSVTPDTGYHITDITIDGTPHAVSNPKQFSHTFSDVAGDHSISTTFAIDTFSVNLGRCISGPSTVAYNDTPTYTFTPGYSVAATVNGTPVTVTNNSYTYTTGITENQTITVVFTVEPIGISAPAKLIRGLTVIDKQTVQDAYNVAESGDVILLRGGTVTGDLLADRAINVSIKGGYEATYSNSCTSTKTGRITIKAGTVRVEYMAVR